MRSSGPAARRTPLAAALVAALLVARPPAAVALGVLENPTPDSTRSGIGVVSGWVCDARAVTIELDDLPAVTAAYGTRRDDTQAVCGDANNGFGLLLNWNLLGDGVHRVRALADGVELGTATFGVQTLGAPFVRGASGTYLLPDFAMRDVIVRWQEAAQNFVLIQDPRTRPAEVVARLRSLDAQERMADSNLPVFIRSDAEALNPEVVELIALGASALPVILAAFDGFAGPLDDVPLTLLAYALEQIGDPSAIPALADWLERNTFSELLWAPDFVTHTLKVLDQQGGLHRDTYTYDVEEKLDAIAQARIGGTADAIATRVADTSAAPPDGGGVCEKRIVVTGVDANGNEAVVRVPYRVHARDIDQQITDETNPTRRAALERQRAVFLANDEKNYGGTDYVPVPGAKVSVKSNCGGSVTERLIRAASAAIGQPIELGEGTVGADEVRDLARTFGSPVTGFSIDTLTVIAHEYEGGNSAHVEIPISASATSAVVFSKDVQGLARTHTITPVGLGFDAVQNRYNFRPFSNFGTTSPRFYRLDPSRIRSIVVDSSACPCTTATSAIPVAFTEPVTDQTEQRVLQVAGTVGGSGILGGTLRVNGSPQSIAVANGAFASEVVLRSGDNALRAVVDGSDGSRGCAERTIRSTTPKTTLSATLTWSLDRADVDLYVTQPDGETAWYFAKTTSIGGRLDVDNTSGFGPENYFLSAAEGDQILPGAYAVRVHYYADRAATDQQPVRAASWRVVVLVNEGTSAERRVIRSGTLATASSLNDLPGASGADWATAATVTIAGDGSATFTTGAHGARADGAGGSSLDGEGASVAGANPVGLLENPTPGSSQSGIGVLSGWVCDARRVTLEVDGAQVIEAAYGTPRGDTVAVCGDANNGFGVLLNWGLLGDGGHRVRAFADGVLIGEARIVVTTLGVPFLRDVMGRYRLPDFSGRNVIVEWQQSQQNFAIVALE